MKQKSLFFGFAAIIAVLLTAGSCKLTGTAQNNKNLPSPDEPAQSKKMPTASPAQAKTYKLPDEVIDAKLKTLDGKTVKLADLKGKVVLVNMWATWCGPCRQEIPELVKISEEMKNRGVEVVGLTTEDDRGNDVAAVKSYVERQKIPYQILISTEEVHDEFGELSNYSIPASFILNRDGELTAIFRGFNPARTSQGVRNAIEEALGGGKSDS